MAFYNKCGYSVYRLLITWCEPILSSDSLLGIKYILGDFTQSGYEKVNDTGYNNKNIYKTLALELGYKPLTIYHRRFTQTIYSNIRMHCFPGLWDILFNAIRHVRQKKRKIMMATVGPLLLLNRIPYYMDTAIIPQEMT